MLRAEVVPEPSLVVSDEGALGAELLVVHFDDVGDEPLGPRRLVLAQGADVGLQVRIQVPLQAPVVHPAPGAVRARQDVGARWGRGVVGGEEARPRLREGVWRRVHPAEHLIGAGLRLLRQLRQVEVEND